MAAIELIHTFKLDKEKHAQIAACDEAQGMEQARVMRFFIHVNNLKRAISSYE
jgi:hypothetical protein